MQVLLARPRGFCAGVTRAIAIVERAIEVFGAPIYVRHEIVHNRTVVQKLRDQGAVFVDEVSEVPDGATLIFSAHGVSKAVQCEAQGRNLRIFDATCPLVTKVHREVMRMREAGKTIIMIGHAGHPEVEGTMGQVEDGMLLVESPEAAAALPADLNSTPLAYVSQTTLSVDDARSVIDVLKRRFPSIVEPKKSDVCYATQNRQDAVKKLAREVDLILVIGSVSSSNSNRLRIWSTVLSIWTTPGLRALSASALRPVLRHRNFLCRACLTILEISSAALRSANSTAPMSLLHFRCPRGFGRAISLRLGKSHQLKNNVGTHGKVRK